MLGVEVPISLMIDTGILALLDTAYQGPIGPYHPVQYTGSPYRVTGRW